MLVRRYQLPSNNGLNRTLNLSSAFFHTANGKECFRRNICSVRPTHRSAGDEELAEFRAIGKRLKYRSLEPVRKVNGLAKTSIEEKLDKVI